MLSCLTQAMADAFALVTLMCYSTVAFVHFFDVYVMALYTVSIGKGKTGQSPCLELPDEPNNLI